MPLINVKPGLRYLRKSPALNAAPAIPSVGAFNSQIQPISQRMFEALVFVIFLACVFSHS